jgi:hypothetical protein
VKIVGFLHSCPPLRIVGGEMMTLRLLNHSAEQGHDVSVVVRELDHDAWFGRVRLVAGHTSGNQGAILEFNKADLIVTHPEIARGVFQYTTRSQYIPSVGIVHNMGRKNLQGLVHRPTMAVVANAHRTAQLLIETGVTGERPITVIYPPTRPPEPPVDGLPRAFCTQVNLSQAKGGEILRRVAKALPEVPFLAVVGGHGEQLLPPPTMTNVTPYGHFSGLGMPYALTKVLLAPSSDETYGMVVAEATALGVPVIASDIAAHREALGDSPTYVDLDDYSGWAQAVKALMLDDDAWHVAHERTVAYGSDLADREAASYARWDQLVAYLASHGEAQ